MVFIVCEYNTQHDSTYSVIGLDKVVISEIYFQVNLNVELKMAGGKYVKHEEALSCFEKIIKIRASAGKG